MGAGASSARSIPGQRINEDDSLTSVHDARLAALLRGGNNKATYSDATFEALLSRNLPPPDDEYPPASETRRRRKTLDRLQELFSKTTLSWQQAAQVVAQLLPDDDERAAVAEFLLERVDASARPAYVAALQKCEPPFGADTLERLAQRASREAQEAAVAAVAAPQQQATRPGDAPATPTKQAPPKPPRKSAPPPRHPNKPSWSARLFGPGKPPPEKYGKHGAPMSPLELILDSDGSGRR